MSRTVAAFLQAAPVQYQEYLTVRSRAKDAGLLDETHAAWTKLVDYLLDDDVDFEMEAEKLSQALNVPIASLRLDMETLEKAEAAVGAAYEYASAFVDGNQSDGDSSVVQGFGRSEEHTSELQSIMRISYAAFCLQN